MNNLELWSRFDDVDPAYTKPITGKPYKGTSPSPHYVVKCLTEMFGPVGIGWGIRVIEQGFQPLGDEILHWCRVEFWHTDRANTFEQYGQTKAYMKTKNGFMSDEDAPKKSQTDALVKCASYIGIAANIFLGRWDDSRYVEAVAQGYRKAEAATPQEAIDHAIGAMQSAETLDQLKAVFVGLPKPVRDHADVIAAKDKRKAELDTPAPIIDDELPY